jgi:DNA-directed RNA polymerase subunit K/omega
LKNPQQSERKIKLTKYEIARVIGARALQLAYDAIPLVEPKPNETPIDIAKREFEEGLLPIIIRRKLPDGSYEDIDLMEYFKTLKKEKAKELIEEKH